MEAEGAEAEVVGVEQKEVWGEGCFRGVLVDVTPFSSSDKSSSSSSSKSRIFVARVGGGSEVEDTFMTSSPPPPPLRSKSRCLGRPRRVVGLLTATGLVSSGMGGLARASLGLDISLFSRDKTASQCEYTTHYSRVFSLYVCSISKWFCN